MSDLISRKALTEHIESEYRQWGEDYDVEQILGDIEDFPAAFDLDKVIAELEKLSMEELGVSESQFEMDKGEYSSYCTLCLYDVVELLKKYLFGNAEPLKTDLKPVQR